MRGRAASAVDVEVERAVGFFWWADVPDLEDATLFA